MGQAQACFFFFFFGGGGAGFRAEGGLKFQSVDFLVAVGVPIQPYCSMMNLNSPVG